MALADIDGDAARSAASEIVNHTDGSEAIGLDVDVADGDQVERMADQVMAGFGSIDVLVNNAGGALVPSRPFDEHSETEWDRVLAVNLKGQWLCCRAVVGPMRSAGYGKIINITSTMAARGYPAGLVPYVTAKAGVVGLTRALAHELGAHGIRVNAVAPGYTPVDRPASVHRPEAAARLRDQMVDEQCLKRTEVPQDLCGAIEFLASDASDFITGQVLNVDGGWVMG